MKVVIVNQPLISQEPSGVRAFIAPLNIAESKLRALIPNTKVEVTDLGQTFDLGQRAVFVSSPGSGSEIVAWKGIPVF